MSVQVTFNGSVERMNIPGGQCCNCGTTEEELVLVHTKLKHVKMFFGAANLTTYTTLFPYCAKCKHTASKPRWATWEAFLLIFMVIVALGLLSTMLFAFVVPPSTEEIEGAKKAGELSFHATMYKMMISNGLTLLLGFFVLWFGRRKPEPPQTSRRVPVHIVKAGGEAVYGTLQTTLSFSNSDYAQRFDELNQTEFAPESIW